MSQATKEEMREKFLEALTEHLVGNAVMYSIALQLRKGVAFEMAKDWAVLRNTTMLFGYPTIGEAEKELREFLWGTTARLEHCEMCGKEV